MDRQVDDGGTTLRTRPRLCQEALALLCLGEDSYRFARVVAQERRSGREAKATGTTTANTPEGE